MFDNSIPAGYSSADDFARAQAARSGAYGSTGASAEILAAPAPATYSGQQAPVSEQFLREQRVQQARAETSVWFDHEVGNARVVNGVHSDYSPAEYLRQHGFIAVNSAGEEVTPSPTQARGLVAEVIQAMARQASATTSRQVIQGISFRDSNRPHKDALVHLRRAF